MKLPKKKEICPTTAETGAASHCCPFLVRCSALLLNKLRVAMDAVLREEQAAFRNNRSCTEQIFTLRKIIEQRVEHQNPLFLNFIEFKKAFDGVHEESLWKISRSYGTPQSYVNIFKSLYANPCCRTETGKPDFFTGVFQLFNSIVIPTITCASETWKCTTRTLKKQNV